MAKKKKKDDGLKQFDIFYSTASSGNLVGSQRAIDKHDAILKFKQLNPGARVREAKEVVPRGTQASQLVFDEVEYSDGVLSIDTETEQEGSDE